MFSPAIVTFIIFAAATRSQNFFSNFEKNRKILAGSAPQLGSEQQKSENEAAAPESNRPVFLSRNLFRRKSKNSCAFFEPSYIARKGYLDSLVDSCRVAVKRIDMGARDLGLIEALMVRNDRQASDSNADMEVGSISSLVSSSDDQTDDVSLLSADPFTNDEYLDTGSLFDDYSSRTTFEMHSEFSIHKPTDLPSAADLPKHEPPSSMFFNRESSSGADEEAVDPGHCVNFQPILDLEPEPIELFFGEESPGTDGTKLEPIPSLEAAEDEGPSSPKEKSSLKSSVGGPRELSIFWDDSFLRQTLAKLGEEVHTDEIIELLEKSNTFIKNYVRTTQPLPSVKIERGFDGCSEGLEEFGFALTGSRFQHSLDLKTDLVIFVYAVDSEDSSLASAMPCGRGTSVGMLRINIAKLRIQDTYSPRRRLKMWLRTFVHELFHILAFHDIVFSGFQQVVDRNSPHLFLLRETPSDPMEDLDAHWNPQYLSNDLMAPRERPDSLLSIFTLEYLFLANKILSPKFDSLPENPLLDSISDWKSYINFRCIDSEPSPYQNFCSMADKAKGQGFGCSADFRSRTRCGKTRLPNNCFERAPISTGMCTEARASGSFDFESFGPESRCLVTTKIGGVCLKASVRSQSVLVETESRDFFCKAPRQTEKAIVVHKGVEIELTFVCPDPAEFKSKYFPKSCPQDCFGNGVCSDGGRCVCFDGYSDLSHCEKRLDSSKPSEFQIGTNF